jgi:cell wall-associated NlpC family hydrolase
MTYLKLVFAVIFSLIFTTSNALSNAIPNHFYHNILGVTSQHLSPSYWQNKLNQNKSGDALLLSAEQISAFNKAQYQAKTFLFDPLSYPDAMSQREVKSRILAISKPTKAKRYYNKNHPLSKSDYQKYHKAMALEQIKSQVRIQYALVLKRSSLRTFPTNDRVVNYKFNTDIDRFQESAVFPGEALAVLHISQDKKWAFIQNYHYQAWVQTADIAIGPKTQIADYVNQEDKLVVTGDKEFTVTDPQRPALSELQLDMGVTLPVISHQAYQQFELSGQNPYANYIVLMPSKNAQGALAIVPVLIPRSADVSIGYLPLTKNALIQQSFKFLGERYGWGHDFNGRDCSGFIGEIYKVFGLHLPRNTGQQSDADIGINQRFTSKEITPEKLAALAELKVGDLIYLSGHVVMVIGFENGQPYVIHDVYDLNYQDPQGKPVTGILNGVSVTPLMPFKGYIKKMYNIKRIR